MVKKYIKKMNGISFMVMFSLTMQLVPGAKRWNDSDLHSPSCSLTEFSRIGQCLRLNHLLTCRNGFASEWISSIQEDISHLTIMEWPGKCFSISQLHQHFPELQIVEFVNSSTLNSFAGQFGASNKIEKIVMHGLTALWEVPPSMVSDMPRLRELDLRGNVLRHLKIQTLTNPSQLQRVYLGENKWDCSDGGLDWLAMEKDNSTVKNIIADYNKLMCHQQLYRGKPLYKVMDVIRMVRQTCPPSCICAMTYVVSDSAGGIIPLITTDCSRRDLKEVPVTLPPSTTTLRLEGNKINTIRMMVQNPQYKNVMELYLDNNSISSVKELEGSELFMTLRVLSLKGNLLKQIPVYAFDKAFQSNTNIMHVFLSHNPWRCDCHYLPRFQGLLLKYKKVIRDFQDVRCSMSEDKTVSLAQISTILPGNVCGSSDVNVTIDYINIINLVLFILILLVVSKFLYDWHSFKTTGKLPWLSSILP